MPSILRSCGLLLLLLAGLPCTSASREFAASEELALDDASRGSLRCKRVVAKVHFENITVRFLIQSRRKVGETYRAKCGPSAANPEEIIVFKCKARSSQPGAAYKLRSGRCLPKEEPRGPPACPRKDFRAQWDVGETGVELHFRLGRTENPLSERVAVAVPCPEGSPVMGQTATFVCLPDATWEIKLEETKKCLGLGKVDGELAVGAGREAAEGEAVEGALPCQLELNHLPLAGGEKGFELLVTCTEPVTQARLRNVAGDTELAVEGITRNIPTRLLTAKTRDYLGKELVFVAQAGSRLGARTILVEAEQPLPAGALPCRLLREATSLARNDVGFKLVLQCEEPITDAVLKVPGFADMKFDSVDKGRWVLTTQDEATFKGKTFVLLGSFDGAAGSTNPVEI